MNYYSLHIGDYRRDTAHLSMTEHGAYRQLLDQYYLNEKPIILDESKLMRSLCVRTADDMQAVKNVLDDFFIRTDEGYIHKRCDVEIEAFHAKSKSASESAKARWERVRAGNDANALRTHCEGNANHKPITNNHKPIKNKVSVADDDFSKFWDAYPKKTGKTDAQKAWVKIKPPLPSILAALTWQSNSMQWKNNGGQYIPNPATYLNQGRWQDEPTANTAATQAARQSQSNHSKHSVEEPV